MIIHDITVPISPELPVYPGDPAVEVTPLMTLAAGDVAAVSRLCCGTHTGTHIDPPAHFIPGGLTVDQLPLDLLVGPCRVLDAGALQVITAEWLAGQPLDGVSRLLFKTSNSALWHRERSFHPNYVYVDPHAARLLDVAAQRGSIRPGLAADLIATPENPLEEIQTLQRVRFVMKEGVVIRQ